MTNLTISIFDNKIFSEIACEIKLFSKFTIKHYTNLDLCIKTANNQNQIVIFFTANLNKKDYEKVVRNSFPLILVSKSRIDENLSSRSYIEQLNLPFSLLDLEKKIILLLSRYKFIKSSLINLNGYIIDKNERKIKKNNHELQLTEKEINFLILFSMNDKPLSRDFVLKQVWNYSLESDTHTVETHIHRLRKKILNKFDDNNFIKSSDKGYYI